MPLLAEYAVLAPILVAVIAYAYFDPMREKPRHGRAASQALAPRILRDRFGGVGLRDPRDLLTWQPVPLRGR